MVALVRMLMSARGLNQVEIARHTGVSATAISRYLNETSELRADALIKILNFLGADINAIVKKEIGRALGNSEELPIGEDIQFLLSQSSPIVRKTVTDSLISSFKNLKSPDTKNRIQRLKKYSESIKTVRRGTC